VPYPETRFSARSRRTQSCRRPVNSPSTARTTLYPRVLE
jgi:hypothetical protein